VIAIHHATQWLIQDQNLGDIKSVNFYSDSQCALNALDFWSLTSRTVQECTNSLSQLATMASITLVWVPAHNGVIGNEAADTEARLGRLAEPPTPLRQWPIELKKAKSMIRNTLNAEWQLLLDSTSISHTKKFFTKLNTSLRYKKDVLQLSRSQLNTVIAWITGHCPLNYHLKRIGQSNSNECRLCQDGYETPNHILRFCKKTKESRQEIQHGYEKSRFKSRDLVWKPGFDPQFECSKPNLDLFYYIIRTHLQTNSELNKDDLS
jgi:hypothetical protein